MPQSRLDLEPQALANQPSAQPQSAATGTFSRAELDSLFDTEAQNLLQRHRLLRPLVKELVLERVLEPVQLTAEEQTQAFEEVCRRRGIPDREALYQNAQQNGVSRADLDWNLLLPFRRARYSRQAFSHLAETTFLRTKGDYDQVVYSLLRLQDPHLAFELYQRIDSGEADFPELASQYSQGTERLTRGLVGPNPLTGAHPLLAELLRTAQPGVVQQPISVLGLSLVVRLEQMVPASFDGAMAQRICEQLFEKWLDEQVNAILSPITKDA